MKVLAIETSCDETAAAIVEWDGRSASVLANTVSSQASLHATWGGVVPNLAAREHIRNIVPVIQETFERAKLSEKDIDLLAVTQGPGLMPALLIGVNAGKMLSLIWQKPLIGIQHLEGHIYANLLRPVKSDSVSASAEAISQGKPNIELRFPLLALIVSGGHTELVLMRDHFQYEVLGETQDDASGEAFDKVAKLLGLPYPGGPEIAKRADAYREKTHKEATLFPRPMQESPDYHFSFSGLKTAVLYYVKKNEANAKEENFIADTAHEFQEAVVDVLVGKTRKALQEFQPKTFVIAGGVSANLRLRERLQALLQKEFPKTQFLTPDFAYSLDNAAMIAIAAAVRAEKMNGAQKKALSRNALALEPNANLPLQSLG